MNVTPVMPSTVTGIYNDGSTVDGFGVIWDAFDYSVVNTNGFTVYGTVIGTNIKATAKVIVNTPVTPISFGIYNVSDDGNFYITNISQNTTFKQFREGISLGSSILKFPGIADEGLPIGTGDTMEINDGGMITTYTLIIFGDVDGNSKIDLSDLVIIRNCLLEMETITGAYFKAGDIYGEGDITLNSLTGIMSQIT